LTPLLAISAGRLFGLLANGYMLNSLDRVDESSAIQLHRFSSRQPSSFFSMKVAGEAHIKRTN